MKWSLFLVILVVMLGLIAIPIIILQENNYVGKTMDRLNNTLKIDKSNLSEQPFLYAYLKENGTHVIIFECQNSTLLIQDNKIMCVSDNYNVTGVLK